MKASGSFFLRSKDRKVLVLLMFEEAIRRS
jgi:hypothetical protein